MRSLERKIGAICRAVAVRVAEGQGAEPVSGGACPAQEGESGLLEERRVVGLSDAASVSQIRHRHLSCPSLWTSSP